MFVTVCNKGGGGTHFLWRHDLFIYFYQQSERFRQIPAFCHEGLKYPARNFESCVDSWGRLRGWLVDVKFVPNRNQRPHHVESPRSRRIPEVKLRRTGWVITCVRLVKPNTVKIVPGGAEEHLALEPHQLLQSNKFLLSAWRLPRAVLKAAVFR